VLTLERVFYSEPHVSIAEFASQLGLWLKKDFRKGKDFIYSPIDSELPDFLSIKHFDGGWKLSSAIQKYPERNLFSTEDIRAGAETFISILFKDLKERYGIDTKLYMKPVRFA
jgi:hypothetical protein